MADLPSPAKYERLAQEYSRLRSNVTVLKKAVVDEKEANTKLTERAKVAEVATRKLEQELEAVRFRNQQLVKRVEVLQTDLDAAGKRPKSRGPPAPPAGDMVARPDQEVLMEQLQKTIEENAKLAGELSECRSQQDAELRTIRDELHATQEQNKRALEAAEKERTSLHDQCSLLRDEKLTLEKQVVERETVLQQRIAETAELRQRLDAVLAGGAVVEEAEKGAEVPHSPTILPTVREATATSLRLLRGVKECHENLALRLSLPYGPLRASTQLTEAVTSCSTAAAALETELSAVDAGLRESRPNLCEERLSALRACLRDYSSRLSASVALVRSRIEDESALSFCPPTLAKRNAEMVAAFAEAAAATEQLRQCADGEVERPAEVGNRLRTAGRELARLFNCKVSLEQKMDDLSDEVKAANEALVHGLLVARSALDKLSPLMADAVFSASGRRVLAAVLASGATDTAPLANGEAAQENGRLEREVEALRASMKELEQARDSLGLEAQLERLRREKEVQRRAELEKELLSLRSHSPGGSLDAADLVEPPQPDSGEREAVIVAYYQEIVARQQQQLYQLTGIAENLRAETENARAQWSLALTRTTSLEQEVHNLGNHTKSVTDDLDSTRRNYEAQISTLTEHIADMNDKLIQRQENIEELRRQMETKEPARRKFSPSSILPEPTRRQITNALLSSVSKRK